MSINHFSVVNPVEVKMKASEQGSLYEAIVAMGLRARQINDQLRNKYLAQISDIAEFEDESVTNYTKLEISRKFESIPKPTFLAMKEMLENALQWRYPASDIVNE